MAVINPQDKGAWFRKSLAADIRYARNLVRRADREAASGGEGYLFWKGYGIAARIMLSDFRRTARNLKSYAE